MKTHYSEAQTHLENIMAAYNGRPIEFPPNARFKDCVNYGVTYNGQQYTIVWVRGFEHTINFIKSVEAIKDLRTDYEGRETLAKFCVDGFDGRDPEYSVVVYIGD